MCLYSDDKWVLMIFVRIFFLKLKLSCQWCLVDARLAEWTQRVTENVFFFKNCGEFVSPSCKFEVREESTSDFQAGLHFCLVVCRLFVFFNAERVPWLSKAWESLHSTIHSCDETQSQHVFYQPVFVDIKYRPRWAAQLVGPASPAGSFVKL